MSTPEQSERRATFCKAERLCSKKRIDALFESGSRSLSAYPVRAVYREQERDGLPVEVLISVSKRHFKHAVDRNRVKRLLRETYRRHKYIVWDALAGRRLSVAFLWQSGEILPYDAVEQKMVSLLNRLAEKMTNSTSDDDVPASTAQP
ncbi:MAG: ribonuclease P protein component [Bacteroidaceae bacterium]|nr:ribonuclease P protein component [Bacteroidaceae bacterium]